MKSLTAQTEAAEIADAAFVIVIGSVDHFTVSTMPADGATKDIVSTDAVRLQCMGPKRSVTARFTSTQLWPFKATGLSPATSTRAHIGTWFARAYVVPMRYQPWQENRRVTEHGRTR